MYKEQSLLIQEIAQASMTKEMGMTVVFKPAESLGIDKRRKLKTETISIIIA